jgi:hypothetical protein
MGVKVKPVYKGAVIDVKPSKPVYADSLDVSTKNSTYTETKNKYAPKVKTKTKHKEGTKTERINEPVTKTKVKGETVIEDLYAPLVNVYTSNVMTDYGKAYLKMLIKLFEETFSEG